jgi:protein-disulfide isomerase
MPSGRRSRERRHVPASPHPSRARTASPRVLLAVGLGAAALLLAVGLAVVVGGRSAGSSRPVPAGTPAVGTLRHALPGAAGIERLLAGIPQHGTTLGSPTAPVTLVEYVDMQCPYCRMLETGLMPSIVQRYVRTGKVRIVLRTWAFIGPDSSRGQAAVLAAGLQARAFNVAALLFTNQGEENTGWLSDELVPEAAASVPGLRVAALVRDESLPRVVQSGAEVARLAAANGITSTPTLVVGPTGAAGDPVAMSGPTDRQALVGAIETALRR